MDRIRQALDRASLERALGACAPLQRSRVDAVPSALSPVVARVRFETLPAAEIDALRLAEFVDVPANSQASDVDRVESPPLQSESECSVTPEDAPTTPCEGAEAIHVPDELLVEPQDHAQAEGEAQAAEHYPPSGRQQVESFSLDRSAYARRSRLSGDAPLIVSLVLGVLITVELAHASLLLLGDRPSKTQAPPQVPVALAPQRREFDVHGIVAAHLFGEAAVPGTKNLAIAQPTTANLLLAGTLAMEDPERGLAIISNDGRSKAYRVGDTVADGELHSVYRDHVLLRRRGLLETLVFPRLRLAKDSNRQPAPATGRDDPPVPHHSSAGDMFREMGSLAPGGKLRGFRIFPTGNAKRFEKSGLNSGDLVVAINGISLENQDRKTGEEMFNSMKTSSQATITVYRNGVRHDVTVNSPSQDDSADSADEPDAADQ